MTDHPPPLLLIGSDLDSINLSEFLQTNQQIRSEITLNEDKYWGLNRFEILFSGMAFEIEQFNISQTNQLLEKYCMKTLFSSPVANGAKSIGLWPGDHLTSGKHLRSINGAFLNVAKILGQNLSVSHIGWLPAKHCTDIEHFTEAVDDYLSGGPTPILLQIAITKKNGDTLTTHGLNYFADQEISLNFPPKMSESEAIKRLIRISHDIAVNGKIRNELETDGLVEGEKLNFFPSSDLSELTINITI